MSFRLSCLCDMVSHSGRYHSEKCSKKSYFSELKNSKDNKRLSCDSNFDLLPHLQDFVIGDIIQLLDVGNRNATVFLGNFP